MKLHILIGPARSGKTTYIDQHLTDKDAHISVVQNDVFIERAIKRLAWLEEQVKTAIQTVCTVPPTAYNTYYRRTFDKLLNTVQQDVLESYKHRLNGVFSTIGLCDLERVIHYFDTVPVVFATTRGGEGSDRS